MKLKHKQISDSRFILSKNGISRTKFRTQLLKNGFSMMQYSVYIRHSSSDENTDTHIKRIRSSLPPQGEVRILRLTDKQFGKMEVFYGEKRLLPEKPALQLQFF